jgi:hypothetical protein
VPASHHRGYGYNIYIYIYYYYYYFSDALNALDELPVCATAFHLQTGHVALAKHSRGDHFLNLHGELAASLDVGCKGSAESDVVSKLHNVIHKPD